MTLFLFKCLALWYVIALAETLHGILRVRYINRRLGNRRARQLSVLTGSALVLTITWLCVPWLGLASVPQSLAVGAGWLMLMLAYDCVIGRLLFRMSWRRIAADFDPRRGGYLGIGMLVVLLAPWLTASWHNIL